MANEAKLAGGFVSLPRRASRRRPDGDWLFVGARPRLSDLEARADAPRAALAELHASLTAENVAADRHLITGLPGSGRTTLLLRLGRDLASEGRQVHLYVPGPGNTPLERFLAEIKRRPPHFLLIDDIDLCPEADTFLHAIEVSGVPLIVLGTACLEEGSGGAQVGLQVLTPATATAQGIRHRPPVQADDLSALAAAMRGSLPAHLKSDATTATVTMLEAMREIQAVLHPDRDWLRLAAESAEDRQVLTGLAIAGLAELGVPREVLVRSAAGRVEAWLRQGLTAQDGGLLLPPHSVICRDFLRELQAEAPQLQAALAHLLDSAAAEEPAFIPRLLSRLVQVPDTRDVALEALERWGTRPGGADSAEGQAWRIAWQVSGLNTVEQAGGKPEPPDIARLTLGAFRAGDYELVCDLSSRLADDRLYRDCAAYNTALAHALAGRLDDAYGGLSQVPSLLPQAGFLQGLLQESREDFESAITSYRNCIEAATLLGPAVRQLAQAHLKICAPRAALQLFEAAIKDQPRCAVLYGGVAVAHLQLGEVDAAQAQSDRAMRAGVPCSEARRAVARAFFDVRAFSRAAGELEACVLADPGDLEAWRDLADASHWAGDFAREEDALRQLLSANPADVAARTQMARCQKDRGNAAAAWEILRTLGEARIATVDAALTTAEVAGLMGQAQEQRQAAEAALALGDESGWALFWMAQAEASIGEDATLSYMRAASVIRQRINDRVPASTRARLWEAILIAALYLGDELALQTSVQSAYREGQLCEATGAKIDSVSAGRAVAAGAFTRQLEEAQATQHFLARQTRPAGPAMTAHPVPPGAPPQYAPGDGSRLDSAAPDAGAGYGAPPGSGSYAGTGVPGGSPYAVPAGGNTGLTVGGGYEAPAVDLAAPMAGVPGMAAPRDTVVPASEAPAPTSMPDAPAEAPPPRAGGTPGPYAAPAAGGGSRRVAGIVLSSTEPLVMRGGDTRKSTLVLHYDDGIEEDVTDRADWSWTGSPNAGQVEPGGLFKAGPGYGSGTINATCDGRMVSSGVIRVRNPHSLAISPDLPASLLAGQTMQFSVTLRYDDGTHEDVTRHATWTWTGDESTGAVSRTGLLTAGGGFGDGMVSVSCDGLTAASNVISVRNTSGLTVTPAQPVVLTGGETLQLRAMISYADGSSEDISEQATWSWSSEPDVGAVDDTGLFTAAAGFGVGLVTATYEGQSGHSGAITVRNPALLTLTPRDAVLLTGGQELQFTANVQFNDGTADDVTGLATWTWSGDADAGAIDSNGRFTAGTGLGQGLVTATYAGRTAKSAVLSVRNVSALRLSVPQTTVLEQGQTVQFTAALEYNDGSAVDVTNQIAWSWDGPVEAGSVSERGLFTAGAGAGTGMVTAAYREWQALSEPLTVRNAVGLELSEPPTTVLGNGEVVALTAVLRYTDETVEDVTETAEWSWTGLPDAGTVVAPGRFVAAAGFGTGVVRATCRNLVADSVPLTVRNLAGLALSPDDPVILATGATRQFAATLHHNDGTTENVSERIVWSWEGDPESGVIDGNGLFTAGERHGTGCVVATCDQWSARSALVTVRNAIGLRISEPRRSVFASGDSEQFAAVLVYDDGHSEDVTTRASWTWDGATDAGSVDSTGCFKGGRGFGAGTISVTFEQWSASSAELSVRNVSGLTLSPADEAVLGVGDTLQFAASLQYNDGTSDDVTARSQWTWSGQASAGAVSDSGLFTAGDGCGAGVVRCIYGERTASSGTLTIRNVTELTVTPTEPAILSAGDEVQFAVTRQYNDGTSEDVTAEVAWSWTGDASAGSVSEDGLFRAGEGFGVGLVTATSGDLTGASGALTVRNLSGLELSPAPEQPLAAGETWQFAAALQYNDGTAEDVSGHVAWGWDGEADAGTIGETGLFTAGEGFGTGHVNAQLDQLTVASETLTVRNVARIVLDPVVTAELAAGQMGQFAATLQYNDGTEEVVTDRATWTWTGPAEAGSVSDAGLFTAGSGCGAGVVTATLDGWTAASGELTIRTAVGLSVVGAVGSTLAAGDSAQFRALLRFNDDTEQDVTAAAQWVWHGPADAGDISEPGCFTAADGFGVGTVVATHGDWAAESEPLKVRNGIGLSLTPVEPAELGAGQSVAFTAVVGYNDGSTDDVTGDCEWAWSGDPAAGGVGPDGVFVAGAGFGEGTVTAQFGAWAGTSGLLTVRNACGLELLPVGPQTLAAGDTLEFAAVLQFNDGSRRDVTAETTWVWTGSEDAAAISDHGVLCAGSGHGCGRVEAQCGDWSAVTDELTVRNVVALQILPGDPVVLSAGEAVQFAAWLHYNDGAESDVTPEAAWTWDGEASAGDISHTGLFTAAPGFGCGTVMARLGDWTASSAEIVVRNVTELALTPSAVGVLGAGDEAQFGALLRYDDGTEEDVTAQAKWSWTGDAEAGAVVGAGHFVGGAGHGTGRVVATVGQYVAESDELRVRNAVGIVLSPEDAGVLAAGQTVQFVALTRFNDGSEEPLGGGAVWSWTGPEKAGAVAEDGLFVAAHGFGTGKVEVTSRDLSATSGTLTVRNPIGLSLEGPEGAVLAAGDSATFAAVLSYNDGTAETVTERVTWGWDGDEAAGSVAAGVFTGTEAFGSGVVTAKLDDWVATSGVLVVRNVSRLELSPQSTAVLSDGDTVQFALTLIYNDSTSEHVTERAQWSWSGPAEAAAIDSQGCLTAGEGHGAGVVTAAFGELGATSDELVVRNVSDLLLSADCPLLLTAGDTAQFTAVLHYNDGTSEDVTASVKWAWEGEAKTGSVTGGLLTAGPHSGTGVVMAALAGATAVSETVTVRNVVELVLTPDEVGPLGRDAEVQFTAELRYDDGAVRDVTAEVTWLWTGDPAVATISREGLLVAGDGCGQGEVRATANGFEASTGPVAVRNVTGLVVVPADCPVLAAADTVQFSARLNYDDGTEEDVTAAATWAWTGVADAGELDESGLFVAGEGHGVGQVTAVFAEWAGSSAEVTVRNITHLLITPETAAVLAAGESIQFTAELHYNDHTAEDISDQATWTWSGPEEAAQITKGGLLSAREGHGLGVVQASYGSWSAKSEPFTVRTACGLALSQAPEGALAAPQCHQFVAQLEYNDGTTADVTSDCDWRWDGPAQAGSVSEDGLFIAGGGHGAGVVHAEMGRWSAASDPLTVRNPAGLSLLPATSLVLAADEMVQFTAHLHYNDGSLDDCTAAASWQWTGPEDAATVSTTGLLTGLFGHGTGSVTATLGEWSVASEAITVRNATELRLSPAEAVVLEPEETLQILATLRYNDGTEEDVTGQASWSWDGDLATGWISDAGLFSAGAGAGTGTVSAAFGPWTASCVGVTVRSVRELVLTPLEPVVLSVGETCQFAATLHHTDGSIEDVTDRVEWAWSGPAAAGALDATGLFTAADGFGRGVVTGTLGEHSGKAAEVRVRNLVELAIMPAEAAVLRGGDTVQFAAELRFNDASTQDVTGEAEWSWSGPAMAAHIAAGLLTAADGFGEGRVKVSYGERYATTEPITVVNISGVAVLPSERLRLQPGQSQAFSANVRHPDGTWHHVSDHVAWHWTGRPETGSVSPDGVFTAGSEPGDGAVTATYAGQTEQSGRILVREPSHLVVLPAEPIVLSSGQTARFHAAMRYASGAEEPLDEDVTWQWSGESAAGHISPDGLFTAGEVCATGHVQALYEGQEARSALVEVLNIANLVVLPSETLSLEPGEKQRFSASLRYVDGTLGDVTRQVQWTWNGPPGAGSISADGVFVAGENGGEGRVSATYAGHSDHSGKVQIRSLKRLELSPENPTALYAGDTLEFTLTAHYSDGSSADVTAETDWSWSGTPGAVRQVRRGAFNVADGAGTGQITAKYKSQSVTTGTLEVRRIVALRVVPGNDLALGPGEQQQFRLLLEYEAGSRERAKGLGGLFRRGSGAGPEQSEDITAQADWQWGGDPRAGSISADGLFRAGDVAEVARVSASYQGQRATSAFITIKAVAVPMSAEPEMSEERIRQRLSRIIADVRVSQPEKPAAE